jgi:hypothetical protein
MEHSIFIENNSRIYFQFSKLWPLGRDFEKCILCSHVNQAHWSASVNNTTLNCSEMLRLGWMIVQDVLNTFRAVNSSLVEAAPELPIKCSHFNLDM